uniref:LITAF domain-containing protein n=1 Tax=Anopheles culicifacies TaxID=139723 RepID=A0A182MJ38_9DIPT
MNILRVKCVFCGLLFDCQRGDTSKLLAHLQNEHSEMMNSRITATHGSNMMTTASNNEQPGGQKEEVNITHSSSSENVSETEELLQRIRITSRASDSHDGSSGTGSSTEDAEQMPTSNNPKRPRQASIESQRSVLYQTSLSCWRPGGQPVCCPDCGAHQIPIVRSHANGVTWSSTVASCFLFCWPLCCLSWFLSKPTSEYLHCARCDQLLAKHDIKSERIAPNYAILDRDDL